eukprot:55431-Eustigmatos_ZCMA.PRE.1
MNTLSAIQLSLCWHGPLSVSCVNNAALTTRRRGSHSLKSASSCVGADMSAVLGRISTTVLAKNEAAKASCCMPPDMDGSGDSFGGADGMRKASCLCG